MVQLSSCNVVRLPNETALACCAPAAVLMHMSLAPSDTTVICLTAGWYPVLNPLHRFKSSAMMLGWEREPVPSCRIGSVAAAESAMNKCESTHEMNDIVGVIVDSIVAPS